MHTAEKTEQNHHAKSTCFAEEIEVFYDGDCPLCMREIKLLRKWDHQKNIRFTNIADPEFAAEGYGTTYEDLMSEIHARLPNGEWIRGVEVFRRLYAAVGFPRLVTLTRLPLVSQMLDFGYHLFARNRLRLTGRCTADTSCRT